MTVLPTRKPNGLSQRLRRYTGNDLKDRRLALSIALERQPTAMSMPLADSTTLCETQLSRCTLKVLLNREDPSAKEAQINCLDALLAKILTEQVEQTCAPDFRQKKGNRQDQVGTAPDIKQQRQPCVVRNHLHR